MYEMMVEAIERERHDAFNSHHARHRREFDDRRKIERLEQDLELARLRFGRSVQPI
jgi:hypothetical protein